MTDEKIFPCVSCGGNLVFKPGTCALACPSCGVQNVIETAAAPIEELDFETFLRAAETQASLEERLTVTCANCAAETTLGANLTADACPFCGTKIVAQAKSTRAIAPRSLLPFKITREHSTSRFHAWLASRWFAPTALKRFARTNGLDGIYTPYWTYDCATTTHYTGQRGEHYWDTETHHTTRNGKTVTETRRVRKTRWHSASGTVQNTFDDVLVLASAALPRKQADALAPWDLGELVPFKEDYLSGFKVQSYSVGLSEGFNAAKEKMDPEIRAKIRADIGGDEQRIASMSVRYHEITFKHVLLPVWISAYRFKDRVYRFLVNARTGEVQGERPYSWVKITLLIASIATLAAALVLAFRS
jgi:predicted RNA-binding Zn-ribbon protein involved in translation (DUF1610 family)